ncbi:MAG: PilZ domain-containing protein [Deltaproteobacteria bacterium]|nr:PilZ domain-containing protein [Deltaproteobacteria bacterium]
MRSIYVELRDRRDFLACYLSDPPHGGMVVRSQEALSEGELLELNLRLLDLDQEVPMRGLVLWRRMSDAGFFELGVGFLATEAVKREELLTGTVDGIYSERREKRYSVSLKVTYETASDFIIDYTRNISSGGIFITSKSSPTLNSRLSFRLHPPGDVEPIQVCGHVAWIKKGQGFGVRFRDIDLIEQERLDKLVGHFSTSTPRYPMALAAHSLRPD